MKTANDLSYEEFLSNLNKGKRCFMKKPRSWQRIWFWWEDKEQWFLNKAYDKRTAGKVEPEPSVWITAKDLESHVKYLERQDYKYYTDE